jgi:hypothetical protein
LSLILNRLGDFPPVWSANRPIADLNHASPAGVRILQKRQTRLSLPEIKKANIHR